MQSLLSDLDFNYPYNQYMDIRHIISDNIKRLTKSRELSIKALGVLSGTSYGNAHRTLNPVEDGYHPSTKSLQSISDGLKIPFWSMCFPDMPVELFESPEELEQMVKIFAKCKPENRKKIIQHVLDVARLDELDRKE